MHPELFSKEQRRYQDLIWLNRNNKPVKKLYEKEFNNLLHEQFAATFWL